ncbi:MAG: hypothetical protein BWY80_01129 [Firmicutes bacterium ADurb.Bin456]|nr:MAG: hypothetical protein BWY80_01129 [Firmicutes bacterium ADurb.Bin456]
MTHQAGGDSTVGHNPQFFNIINKPAAGAPHGISGADNHRIAEVLGNFFRFLNGVSRFAAGQINSQPVHGFLKSDSVLAPFDGFNLYTDKLNPVFFQDAGFMQFQTQI